MNNNDLFQASRRRFLAQLGGLTVAGMLGPSLLTPRVFVIRWYAWTGCVSAISAIPPSAVITVLCA
ncbi:trimethylamine-N-oxide reductase 1 domain protein [Escherichia coli Jurua 20/10]|nr:trimethylamine-N-oxide reductase 1 domain protein [Escherichia coli Jurua 20/10]